MLILLFHVDKDSYALDCRQVIEISPLVRLASAPGAPPVISGLCNWRGTIVPVLDLCQLLANRPCRACLSTRIIFVSFSDGHTLGLMAERVTETLAAPESALTEPPIRIEGAPYLGRILMMGSALVKCLRVELMLTDEVREMLRLGSETTDDRQPNV